MSSDLKRDFLKMPSPRSWAVLALSKGPLATMKLDIGENEIIFREGIPIAFRTPEVLYYPDVDITRTISRVVNALAAHRMLQRTQIHNFDFLLAQALISIAMPWTKVELKKETP